jgi:hypothetical protein
VAKNCWPNVFVIKRTHVQPIDFYCVLHMIENENTWRVLVADNLLAKYLNFSEQLMLAQLNRLFCQMCKTVWQSMWKTRCEFARPAKLAWCLQLAICQQKLEHVKVMLQPMASRMASPPVRRELFIPDSPEKSLLLTVNDHWELNTVAHRDYYVETPSYLFLAIQEGQEEIVDSLLEVGGRELVLICKIDGSSSLFAVIEANNMTMMHMLLRVGGNELTML